MLIHAMPDALSWNAPRTTFDTVHASWVDLLSDALGRLLLEAQQGAPDAAAALTAELDASRDGGFVRVLLAPEASYRLIFRREPLAERVAFVTRALRLEAALAGDRDPRDCAGEWSALGDAGVDEDGTWRDLPRLAATLPFDVASCHAAAVDLGGPSGTAPRPRFTASEQAAVVAKINGALAGIARTGDIFRSFVQRFNNVLIAQIDRDDAKLFTSGSTGQYVGRSFVTNPQRRAVRPVDLAEALVHEGIHALLYMQERRVPWVHRHDLYDPLHARVVSPWTGATLGVRPFLQACFVWYGLLHFWAAALQANAFPAAEVRERMEVAMRGFLAAPLATHLGDCRDDIGGEVLAAIADMQDRVVRSWRIAA